MPVYYVIRYTAYILLIIICAVLILRVFKKKKKPFKICIAALFLIAIVTISQPIENIFITFDSPEALINYYSQGEVVKVIDGNESCCAVSLIGEDEMIHLIPKSNGGYKIPDMFTTSVYSDGFAKDKDNVTSLKVYNVNGTNDYYITGVGFSDSNDIMLSDNFGSQPYVTINECAGDPDSFEYSFYSYAQNFPNKTYCLTVNGKDMQINWQ